MKGKKLNTIILLALIFMLLVPLSARGQFGTSGSGRRGSLGLPWGWLIVSLLGGSSYNTPNVIPADKSHGILQIKVETQDAEIYVDSRFIGRARDFKGPAMVSVPSGKHVAEFKYNGLSFAAVNVDVVPNSTTFIVR
ncbi:MAG: hypothetical protein HYW01_07370 [Deltaproteobacteria bacterium]|nr:hypothetical protein [Deltaproteobacteria bacterium]